MDSRKAFLSFILILIIFSIFKDDILLNLTNPAAPAYNEGVSFQRRGEYEVSAQKFSEALEASPDLTKAKEGLIYDYQMLLKKYFDEQNYQKAVLYARKLEIYTPDNNNNLQIIAECYFNLKNYIKAAKYYEKALVTNQNDTSLLRSIAQSYVNAGEYAKALPYVRKIVSLEPNDKQMQNNIKYLESKVEDSEVTKDINNLKVTKEAPPEIYSLVRTNLSSNILGEVQGILDLIWSEPSGRIILTALWQKHIPINIIKSDEHANTKITASKKGAYYSDYDVSSINIPVNYILNFNDESRCANDRIYNFHTFLHEFGHAYFRIKNPQIGDSMEEELGVSMIGYNISYKIITGKYMTIAQTQEISLELVGGMLSDDHRNLPVYSGFDKKIQSYGVVMPYLEVYSDIRPIYKKLRAQNEIQPVKSLE